MVVALALILELGAWLLGEGTVTTDFAWFRVVAHAGRAGLAGAILAGVLGAVLAPRLARVSTSRSWAPWLALALAALVAHLPWVGMPQGQPDTVDYFVYAQALAADPLGALARWPTEVWGGPQGRFHTHFPLAPLIYAGAFRLVGESLLAVDLVLTAVAVALPLALGRATAHLVDTPTGLVAGFAVLGLPFLAAQSGWMLVDGILLVGLALAWGLLWRGGWLGALVAPLAPLVTKASAALFLLGPGAAALLQAHQSRRRALVWVGGGLVGVVALALVRPPRWRDDPSTWLDALLALGLHGRPGLWVLALAGLWTAGPRLRLGVGGVLATLPVLVLYAPAEHVPRYGLPLVLAAVVAAAPLMARQRSLLGALVGSGLVLGTLGYRPVVVHHQAANVQLAAERLERLGAQGVEVWGDHPDTTFPPAAVAALVDLHLSTPVHYGGSLGIGEPEAKRHWWEFYEPPAHHVAPPAEAPTHLLLSLHGSRGRTFEAEHGAEWTFIEEVSLYRSSSTLLPMRIRLYERNTTTQDPGAVGGADR